MSGRGSGRGRGAGRGGGRGGRYYQNRYGGGRGRGGVGRGGDSSSNNAVGGVAADETNKNGSDVAVAPPPQDAPPQDAPRPSEEVKFNGGSDYKGGGGVATSGFQSQQVRGGSSSFDPNAPKVGGNNGGTHTAFLDLLRRIDGKNYPAYHDIESSTKGWVHEAEGYTLYIARAQSDPFAKATRCRIVIKSTSAKFPPVSYQNKIRSVALGDYLNRVLYDYCKTIGADVAAESKEGGGYHHGGGRGHYGGRGHHGGGWDGPKGGDIEVSQIIIFSLIYTSNHY